MSEERSSSATAEKGTYRTFDDILKVIGQFGPYQKRVYVLLCLPSFLLAPLLVFQVFILAVPAHR